MAGNTIKGLTVEIGGDTTKLGKALEDVNRKSGNLSKELGQINKLLKLDPGNMDLLAQKQKVLTDAISNTKEKLDTLKQAQKQVQEQFERGEVSEEQYRALQREIVATEQKLNGYETGLQETEDAMKNLGKETDKTKESTVSFGEVSEKVLKAAAAALAAMATAAGAAVKALVDFTVSGAQYADTVLTESTVTGIATDKLQEYMYAAELVDVSTETLTRSMAKNIKSMTTAAKGSGDAADAYKRLGVEVTDANGGLRDSETVYWELIDALGQVENETERDSLAMTLLGKSAQELNPLIEAGAERMAELGQEARAAGYVLDEQALGAFGAFDDQMQRLKVGSDAAKNALGTVLLPVLTDLATDGVELLGEFTNGVQDADGDITAIAETISTVLPKAMDRVSEVLPGVLGMVSALVDSLVQALPQLLQQLVVGIMAAAPALMTTVSNVISQIIITAAQLAPELVGQCVVLLSLVVSTIAANAPAIIAAVVDMVPQIITQLLSCAPDLLDAAILLLMSIVDAIPEIVASLVDQLPNIIATIIDVWGAAYPQLLQAGASLLKSIVNAIPQIVTELVQALPSIITTIVTHLAQNTPAVLKAAIEVFMTLVKAIPTVIVDLVKALPSIITAIVQGLSAGVSSVFDVGRNLVQGLWNGISNMTGWIISKVQGFASSILGGIKGVLGIHSPSTEMAWIGKMLDEGMAEGIEDNADAPLNAMRAMSDDLLGEASGLDGVTVNRQLQETIVGKDAGLLGKLDRILSAIEAGKIIALDGDALVGATVGRYDTALGQRRLLAARGAI